MLAGADAAVVRAALVGGLSLYARELGSRQDGLNCLALVAAVLALIKPNVLWDGGFQPSFMATLGLVLYAEPFSQAFVRAAHPQADRRNRPADGWTGGRVCPVHNGCPTDDLAGDALHFPQAIDQRKIGLNPLILPVQPAVMSLGRLAVLVGLILQPLGQLLAYVAWPFVAYTIRMVDWFANWRGGVLAFGQVILVGVLLFYLVLFLWNAAGDSMEKVKTILRPGALLAVLGMLTVFVWRVGLSAPDGRLHLTVLDVGSGEALLIQTPGGRYVLVNGGQSTRTLSEALGRRMPLLHCQLDFLVVAGVDDEQIGGLAGILERYSPVQVLWSGPTAGTVIARDLQHKLSQVEIPLMLAQAGQVLDLGDGAQLRILSASRRGATLALEWGSFRALLPVGLDFDQLEAMQSDPNLGLVSALLLAESGLASLNPPDWIAGLSPQYVLLSVGAGDERSVLEPEREAFLKNYNLLRTDENGWIHLSTDGDELRVEVERR